ncbi:MAG: VWA domain-containing protein [Saprospiraceae bacterium]|nr:VWA domain-containing protein [Saprospiraceae bacterium]
MLKLLLTSCLLLNSYFQCNRAQNQLTLQPDPIFHPANIPSNGQQSKIQVALLLDTSNSMDGLIDQAKAQLWKMVNKLAGAKKKQQIAELEIALYEYGNSGLNAENGYIRMVQPLGKDLDGLSEKLFELRTNGGDEYCGWVIKTATEQLSWSTDPNDLKIIVIAGNEPFNQGKVDYKKSCEAACAKGIVINTIHCGDRQTGINSFWMDGASVCKGKYMIIDTDQKVVHISTPYDARMMELSGKMNATYIGYGSFGEEKKMRQVAQDKNAETYGAANATQRAASKAKASYSNEDWDIVDASDRDKDFLKKVDKKDLPKEFQGKSDAELQKEIERLKADREAIRKEIAELEKKINTFIAEETKKQTSTQTLDNVLIQAVVDQAKDKGFEFGE